MLDLEFSPKRKCSTESHASQYSIRYKFSGFRTPPPLSSFLYSKKAVRVKGVQGCEPTELKAVGTSQSQITSLSPLEQCVYGISYLVTLFSLIF